MSDNLNDSWQPITALPFTMAMTSILLEETKDQFKHFLRFIDKVAQLENMMLIKLYNYYNHQLASLYFFVDQIQQWRTLKLTQEQEQEIDQLSRQLNYLLEINELFVTFAQILNQNETSQHSIIPIQQAKIKALRNKIDPLLE